GRIQPSTLLRKLGTASRKNKLYFAFRELGRVVRTLFLLEYISDDALVCHEERRKPFMLY
ncbi:MAG: Tn3 family transposase, partial [Methylobacter sp.]|nr:Tn3 family transposase [Methylobacter sp.]